MAQKRYLAVELKTNTNDKLSGDELVRIATEDILGMVEGDWPDHIIDGLQVKVAEVSSIRRFLEEVTHLA